jgi:hypothetical protein
VTHKRILMPILVAMLALGFLAAFATAETPAGSDSTATERTVTNPTGGTTTLPSATSTDQATSTAPTTTTGTVSTTVGVTTTEHTTSASTTEPTTSTTVGSTTSGTTTQPTIAQTTTQGAPTTDGATMTTSSPPTTAPCDTTQITCGNNASTQVAIVSQTCASSSGGTVLSVEVTTLAGTPVNNVTISPSTTCLNMLAITQVVQQFCVGCTIIVIPPPPPAIPYAVTTTIVEPGPVSIQSPPTVERVMAYCMPQPVLRTDGTVGTLLYLDEGQPSRDSRYAAATPALYIPGSGMTCPVDASSTKIPMFTLTVPASLVGQYVNLCIQAANPSAKPACHSIRIDTGATISIPVTSNVAATVVKRRLAKQDKPKSKAAIAGQSKFFALSATTHAAKKTARKEVIKKGGHS